MSLQALLQKHFYKYQFNKMRSITQHLNRIIFRLTFVAILVIALGSCARKIAFNSSPVVPGAEGKVKVDRDKNNNYNIELDINRLAEANKLTPPKSMYVVWMETESNGTKNLGRMNTRNSLFSNNVSSSLKTVSPFKPKRIFVTAEDTETLQYPGSFVVLSTNTF